MRVKIYSVDQNAGAETFEGECDLAEAFIDDDDYQHAAGELTRHGRYWSGGGAAHLSLLTLVR